MACVKSEEAWTERRNVLTEKLTDIDDNTQSHRGKDLLTRIKAERERRELVGRHARVVAIALRPVRMVGESCSLRTASIKSPNDMYTWFSCI